MLCISIQYAIGVILCATASVNAKSWRDFKPQQRVSSSCPDYVDYSQEPHSPLSQGALKLPYMRPKEQCRTFKSPAVEVDDLPTMNRPGLLGTELALTSTS